MKDGALPDGTIALPSGTQAHAHPALRGLVFGVFALVVLGSAIADTFWPAPVPIPIGREKVIDDARRETARWSNGSRMALLDDDLKLASRVRNFVRPRYAVALYDFFDEAAGSDVVRGTDDWLFLESRTGAALVDPLDETLERSGLLYAALHRRLANLGVRLVSVPLPRKCVVEREHLPAWVHAEEALDESIVATWRSRGVETVDLTPLFENPPGDPLYFKQGTHWTNQARVFAAEEIARQAGLWTPPEQRSTRLQPSTPVQRDFDMFTRLGFGEESARRRAGVESEPMLRLAAPDGTWLVCQDPDEVPALAIGGTSFTNVGGLACYLRHFADQPVLCIARAGSDGITPLSDFLRHSKARPSTLILETPNHILLSRAYIHSITALLATHPPETELTTLPIELPIDAEFTANAKHVPAGRGLRVTHLDPTKLGTSGDGVAELRLEGKATLGEIEIVVAIKEVQRYYRWRAGQPRVLVLPLLAHDNSIGAVQVRCRSVDKLAKLELTAAPRVVIAGDKRVVDFDAGAIERRNERSTCTLTPAAPAQTPRHAALWIQLEGGAPAINAVRATVHASGGEPMTWEFQLLDSAAPIVINIGALEGRTLERIELSAANRLPGIRSARVIAP